MSIFSDITSKLFGHSSAHAAPATPAPGHPAAPASPAAPSAGSPATPAPGAPAAHPASATPAPDAPSPAAPSAAATPAPGAAQVAAAVHGVDVTAVLDGLVAKHHEKLDWRHSIVDLLKALDMDSSLSARKELAAELHYTGSTADTASMNVWLIKEVITKLAANGGKLPPELLH